MIFINRLAATMSLPTHQLEQVARSTGETIDGPDPDLRESAELDANDDAAAAREKSATKKSGKLKLMQRQIMMRLRGIAS
ncbi:MAG TPA: hypothetical protein VMU69_06230 [Bradyrhizobium sp.]|nr:hypothetical protein [Bradyrhizobium sp.]